MKDEYQQFDRKYSKITLFLDKISAGIVRLIIDSNYSSKIELEQGHVSPNNKLVNSCFNITRDNKLEHCASLEPLSAEKPSK